MRKSRDFVGVIWKMEWMAVERPTTPEGWLI